METGVPKLQVVKGVGNFPWFHTLSNFAQHQLYAIGACQGFPLRKLKIRSKKTFMKGNIANSRGDSIHTFISVSELELFNKVF